MLPVKLQLHNFMSYGEEVEPLDFRGVDLACISGNNGVGKSTLLEAITWVLWGKSRAKSDDDLIRLGIEEMWVDFEFELEGTNYRVVRKRTKKKKKKGGYATSGSFDFMIANQGEENSEDNWRSVSEHSKAETQDKIIEILRMDYDTFINSAFLRQGHADEFTIKKPTERKAILADILGLSYYDKLQEKAKELRRSRDVEKESSEQLVENLSEELDSKESSEEEEKKIKKILDKAQAEI
ncbi:MAG: SMC family ATPase, partial [Parcubacteria group bacterium]|nr:SMC family ATPase [Parcubacteria group bacterium]